MVSRWYREEMLEHVFGVVYVRWESMERFVSTFLVSEVDLQENWRLSGQKLLRLVHDVVIYRPNNKLEWHLYDQVETILEKLEQVQRLRLTISSASFCLRYFKFKESIKVLELATERPNSQFNLEHVAQFKFIDKLVLQKFQLVSFGLDVPVIKSLVLENCSWEYPFQLVQFSSKALLSLTIKYRDNNNFLLSERFKSFLGNVLVSDSLECVKLDLLGNESIIKYANISGNLNLSSTSKLTRFEIEGAPIHRYPKPA